MVNKEGSALRVNKEREMESQDGQRKREEGQRNA